MQADSEAARYIATSKSRLSQLRVSAPGRGGWAPPDSVETWAWPFSTLQSVGIAEGIKMECAAGNVLALEPRGLNRVQAAAYVGVSPTLFDEMVQDGRMPQPKRINSRRVWDRRQLDEAFEALPNKDDPNPWDAETDAAT